MTEKESATLLYTIVIIIVTIVILFGANRKAEAQDEPYLHMGAIVATMATCALVAPKYGIDKSSHCYYSTILTTAGALGFKKTRYHKWAGIALACGGGAIVEIIDHYRDDAVSSLGDWFWTCGPAIPVNLGLNGVIKFYDRKAELNINF